MRLSASFLVCLCLLVALTESARERQMKRKPAPEDETSVTDEEDDFGEERTLRRNERKKEPFGEDEEDDMPFGEEDENEVLTRNKQPKAPKKESKKSERGQLTKGDASSEKNGPLEICSGDDDEMCHCEDGEVSCNNILIFDENDDDGKALDTLDVVLKKDGFKAFRATFADNAIVSLRKNFMPEGMDDTLAFLDLSHNMIRYIENGAFSSFENLTVLNLANNRLNKIQKEYFLGESLQKKLKTLDFTKNSIHSIDGSPFKNLKALKKLILDYNFVGLTDDTFEGLDNLQTLSLDYCGLSELDAESLKPLTKLKSISLRGNDFKDVPPALSVLTNLKNIDLSENPIEELRADSFQGTTGLEILYFDNMPKLYGIDDCAFCNFDNLKELSFTNCTALSDIHPNAFGYEQDDDGQVLTLEKLDLSACNITNLDINLYEWDELDTLVLSNNPLNCTCSMAHLFAGEFYKNGYLTPRCKYPAWLANELITSVDRSQVCGGNVLAKSMLILSSALAALILLSVGYLIYQNYLRGIDLQIPLSLNNMTYRNLNKQSDDRENLEIATGEGEVADFQPRGDHV